MRIDCAVSLCDRAKFTYSWAPHRDYSADDLSQILARNRFDGAIAGAQTGDPAETDWLLALAAQYPWIAGVLARGGEPRDWDRWQRQPAFLGVEPSSPSTAAELAARGLICRMAPPAAVEALSAAPSLRLVVRAMAGLSFTPEEFERWAASLEPFRAANALIQVDGLLDFAAAGMWRADTYRPWVRHLLEAFGPARIAYGSGWPLSMPHCTWKESLACFTQAMGAQTWEDRALMLGENALNYYRPAFASVGYTEGSPSG